MSVTTGETDRDLEDLETVQFVASAFFDVSAEKIARLRLAFEKNGIFYTDISDLYESIKHTAINRNDIPTARSSPIRKVYVAFTSNVRFYGSVNTDVMVAFLERMSGEEGTDAMIIGRTGKIFMEGVEDQKSTTSMTYLSFEADEPTKDEMQIFLDRVASYDEVHIFYPSFVNVFTQKITSIDITHTIEKTTSLSPEEEIDYIFEPELPQIIHFFETRVRYLLFQRVALESELARTAARLFAMNRAQDRVGEEITKVRNVIRKNTESLNDLRLLESFATLSKWKT